MILVDTSAWIEFFRGRGSVADRVDDLLDTDAVAICGPILTELRRGFRSRSERQRVLPLFSACHALEAPKGLWEEAGDLGFSVARKGMAVKTLDLLIATYALSYSVPLLTADRDFALLRKAGVPLVLA
jgi:predicted nucleic acid-binding protein